MAQIKVTQVRSVIGRPKDQRATIEALGLGKIGKSNTIEKNPAIEGMVRKVHHLVTVEEI